MKLNYKNIKKWFSKKDLELLKEDLLNKGKSINTENQNFNNDLLLLKQEVNKRKYELMLYYKTEYNKLLVKHNQKMNQIHLQ